MSIKEIFPNPTVKQVIFQIRFNPIFYLELKMGDFQMAIIKKFPESSLIVRSPIRIPDTQKPDEELFPSTKLWQFKSVNGDILNVEFNSVSLVSEHYKTYQLGEGEKFRDLIKFVTDAFIDIMKIPIIKRIGLRYIDDNCPFPSRNESEFNSYYNTATPINRFNLESITESFVTVIVKKEDCSLRYIERISQENGKDKFTLDFDGFSTDIDATEYLNVSDKLHTVISEEYEKTLKEPVYKIMRENR